MRLLGNRYGASMQLQHVPCSIGTRVVLLVALTAVLVSCCGPRREEVPRGRHVECASITSAEMVGQYELDAARARAEVAGRGEVSTFLVEHLNGQMHLRGDGTATLQLGQPGELMAGVLHGNWSLEMGGVTVLIPEESGSLHRWTFRVRAGELAHIAQDGGESGVVFRKVR
jgi:hypothetical protein